MALRKVEDIGTSEFLGKAYRTAHPKDKKKSSKGLIKKSISNLSTIIIIVVLLVVATLLFLLKNKLNISYPKSLMYLNSNLLKDKCENLKKIITNLFSSHKYIKN